LLYFRSQQQNKKFLEALDETKQKLIDEIRKGEESSKEPEPIPTLFKSLVKKQKAPIAPSNPPESQKQDISQEHAQKMKNFILFYLSLSCLECNEKAQEIQFFK